MTFYAAPGSRWLELLEAAEAREGHAHTHALTHKNVKGCPRCQANQRLREAVAAVRAMDDLPGAPGPGDGVGLRSVALSPGVPGRASDSETVEGGGQ